MTPRVVHCEREPYDVYIGRPGPWGNPWPVGDYGTREQVIALYEDHLLHSKDLRARLPELRGKVLGCWCAPLPCHGDVLLKWANARRSLLVTCSRTWRDWDLAQAALTRLHDREPGLLLLSGHAFRGDRDLERIWSELGGEIRTFEPDWSAECAPDCWPPYHRRRREDGSEYCPAAGDRRNKVMAQQPGVVACLAFIARCRKPGCRRYRDGRAHGTHGALDCANYAEYEMGIRTKRFLEPALAAQARLPGSDHPVPGFRSRPGPADVLHVRLPGAAQRAPAG